MTPPARTVYRLSDDSNKLNNKSRGINQTGQPFKLTLMGQVDNIFLIDY